LLLKSEDRSNFLQAGAAGTVGTDRTAPEV